MRDLRAGLLVFLDTPAARCTASTDGRFLLVLLVLWLSAPVDSYAVVEDDVGRETALRDLSVLMEGEVARRAARECFEGAAVGGWGQFTLRRDRRGAVDRGADVRLLLAIVAVGCVCLRVKRRGCDGRWQEKERC